MPLAFIFLTRSAGIGLSALGNRLIDAAVLAAGRQKRQRDEARGRHLSYARHCPAIVSTCPMTRPRSGPARGSLAAAASIRRIFQYRHEVDNRFPDRPSSHFRGFVPKRCVLGETGQSRAVVPVSGEIAADREEFLAALAAQRFRRPVRPIPASAVRIASAVSASTMAGSRWAPPIGSAMMPSMTPSCSRSWAVIFMAVATSWARVASRHRIEAAASGEATE